MSNQLKVGVAETVITPPLGVELWGYARQGEFIANGVYDDLYLKVLILDSSEEGTPIALIALDLGGLNGQWVEEVRQIIEEKTPISSERVIFSVTHTHAGPAPFAGRGLGNPNYEYLQTLKNTVVKTIKEALANRVSMQGGVGIGHVDLSLNRRQRSLNGPIGQDPGTVDPQVRVYRLDKQNGDTVALLVNYTAHPTTLGKDNRKFSADYPGAMIRAVKKNLMSQPQVFFFQGASANVEPRLRGNYQITEEVGALLAQEVLRITVRIQTQPLSRVLIRQKSLAIHWQEPPSFEQVMQDLEEDQKRLKENPTESQWYDPGWRKIRVAWQKSLLKQLQAGKKPLPLVVPLQVLTLNGTYWVTLPGEAFVEVGLMIQDRFPDQIVFIVGYANDTRMGYIPTKEAYLEEGYEVDAAFRYYGLDLPVARGTAERLAKEVVELMKQS